MMAVQMFVHQVLIDFRGNALIVLADEQTERLLRILIGPCEARAIAQVLKGEEMERPMTHDLFAAVITGLGYELRRVTITKLEEDTFFASLALEDSTLTVDIDARPSDAIALALRTGSPIYVDEEVLDRAGVSAAEMHEEADEIERFKDLMRDVDVPDSIIDRDILPHEDEDTEDEQ